MTQPLCANYGGILQNLALQKVLKDLGHTPITLDLCTHLNMSKTDYVIYCFKTLLKCVLRGEKFRVLSYNQKRPSVFDAFVKENIITTRRIDHYSDNLIADYNLNCLIVGSDQVWRPKFNVFPEDMFLAFAEGRRIKRIAYAASFGTDCWEYNNALTIRCKRLLSDFDGISVREESGIKLCKNNLDADSTFVVDPTLLFYSDYYNNICKDIDISKDRYVAVYTLNISEKNMQLIKSFALSNGLKVKCFTSDTGFTLSVPEWISLFRDATFVITDSFHGTVFSIIYQKNFVTLTNNGRGGARFYSLLNTLGLEKQFVGDCDFDYSILNNLIIDWETVNKKREILVSESVAFLKNYLQ